MKRSIAAILFVNILLIFGCGDAYFSDGGLEKNDVGVLNATTMNYLESQKTQFDTLTRLIRLCGLEAEVNKQGNTFFAPQDYSIHNYIKLTFPDENSRPGLSQLSSEQKAEIAAILKNYIIPDQKIERGGLSTAYSFATTQGGKKARFNLVREDYLGNVNMGASYLVFALDVSRSDASAAQFQAVTVVTSGLQSTNGIVHVLDSNTHIFGFK